MFTTSRRLAIAATLATALISAPALAQELTGTLKKIRDTGVITLGHRESSIPFSYYDDKQQVVGYSQDMMLKVVDAIKAELKLAKLDVKLVPVTSENRITLVQNGTVDLECGSTTNTTERQKQVSFSNSIFVVGTRLMTRNNSGINDFRDLAGKTVVTTAGTTSERLLRKMNDSNNMRMKIISAKDHGEAFLTLETGRAAAFVMDEVLLYGKLANARNASDWAVVGTPQSLEAYGCMMRKDDLAFKKVVDAALAKAMTSGEADRIYTKWFLQPIPPKGLNLNFQMSYALKKLYKSPSDKAYD
ncbi:MAG: glutamate/aspartate ABC transporter substrate-binding protein [Candidatus Accumulibacter sp.]|uniref:glutamate/aspartate ABC transporter substrate-binding protein n=1 Tax=Accumulibacter sp. TaxID=2053492 RepID=UPI001A586F47|nr:glutamate/aspartate ABC transporter substrate-binding protein [Accumulibacter sp.]MBL8392151.1 glutamate/aspartate ABC transporter substrate-binding protein [Accumulibacter sp.]HRD87414.1 glutamate/aspartate ABC transporter substrate-binding protein [Accumulibacter sp.]